MKISTSIAKDRPSVSPESVDSPYLNLGTHPELVQYLWDNISELLPEDCRWIVYGTPVLMEPETKNIFAFAEGTKLCALLLPVAAYEMAIKEGAETVIEYRAYPMLGIPASRIVANDIGQGWLFCRDNKQAKEWCHSAYENARSSKSP